MWVRKDQISFRTVNMLHICIVSLSLSLSLSLWDSQLQVTLWWPHCESSPALSSLNLGCTFFGITRSDLVSFSFLLFHLFAHSLPDKIKLIFILKLYLILFTIASNSKPIIPQAAYIQGTLLNFQVTIIIYIEKAKRNFLTVFLHMDLALWSIIHHLCQILISP